MSIREIVTFIESKVIDKYTVPKPLGVVKLTERGPSEVDSQNFFYKVYLKIP